MVINKCRIREGRFYYVGYSDRYYMLLDISISAYEKLLWGKSWKYEIVKYIGTWRGDLRIVDRDFCDKAKVRVNFDYDRLETKFGVFNLSSFHDYNGDIWSLPRSPYEDIVEKQRKEEQLRKNCEEEKIPLYISEMADNMLQKQLQQQWERFINQYLDEQMRITLKKLRANDISDYEFYKIFGEWLSQFLEKGIHIPPLSFNTTIRVLRNIEL